MPVRDFRPTELDTLHTSKTVHRLEITHKKTGVKVAGTGENKYALECKLLEILREKLAKREIPSCLQ